MLPCLIQPLFTLREGAKQGAFISVEAMLQCPGIVCDSCVVHTGEGTTKAFIRIEDVLQRPGEIVCVCVIHALLAFRPNPHRTRDATRRMHKFECFSFDDA